MSHWPDPFDNPTGSDPRVCEIAAILGRGLIRWHSRRNRDALSFQNLPNFSANGLEVHGDSRPDGTGVG